MYSLFYSGHGNIDGAWIVNADDVSLDDIDSKIVFQEVWDIIYETGYKGGVEITSDSCYSGKIVLKAQEFWMDKTKYPRNIVFLRVFSSAYHDK